MSTKVKLNMNTKVTVVLTSAGMDVIKKLDPAHAEIIRNNLYVCKGDLMKDVLVVPLWELFQIFGNEIRNGAPIVFKHNSVYIENSDLIKSINSQDVWDAEYPPLNIDLEERDHRQQALKDAIATETERRKKARENQGKFEAVLNNKVIKTDPSLKKLIQFIREHYPSERYIRIGYKSGMSKI